MPTAEILSQGDEVVTGQITDTNAAWLATRLTDLGFDVRRHLTVGDRLEDLVHALHDLTAAADVVICTGGLGPTDDDLTAPAVATAFDRPQQLDEVALAGIVAMYKTFGVPMPAVNQRQAMLPSGSLRLDNRRGTAPGFALDVNVNVGGASAFLACMPGVPHEMKAMFEQTVVPQLLQRFALTPGRLVTLRTTGIGESTLQERIGPFTESDAVLGYRTTSPENHVKLRFAAGVPDTRIRAIVNAIAARIGAPLFSVDGLPDASSPLPSAAGVCLLGGDLVNTVARGLLARGETLAVAESCTGGLVASQCTGLAGASAWFIEGVIVYDNAAKVRRCGVQPGLLTQYGAVSEPVARQLAEGVRRMAGATWGVGITGIAGPSGGSPDKPVGTVHFALAGPTSTTHLVRKLPGDRSRVQALAAGVAFDLVRRQLQGLTVSL